ncbi:MAG: hypothetical protein Q4G69_03145 [Planctomycetia bacterium]|nr:hypothetical protein [Planctomycetia bacterium]
MSLNSSSTFVNTSEYLVCGPESVLCSRFDAMLPFEPEENAKCNEAEDLCSALSLYQMINRRRYLTFDELIHILHELGYRRES